MKRLLLGFSFLCLSLGGFGQQVLLKAPATHNNTGINVPNSGKGAYAQGTNSNKYSVSQWYSWLSGYDSAMTSIWQTSPIYDNYPNYLYPDSSVKLAYYNNSTSANESRYNNTISAGSCFDPKAHFVFGGNALSIYNSYTLDSLSFLYYYTRSVDSLRDTVNGKGPKHLVVDTMIVQWYVLDANAPYYDFWQNSNQAGQVVNFFGAPQWNRTLEKGVTGPSYEMDIPLTSKDTSKANTYTPKSITTNHLALPAGSVIAATVTYHPGSKIYDPALGKYKLNNFGDTVAIEYDPNKNIHVKNPINSFQVEARVDSFGIGFDEPGISAGFEQGVYDSFGVNNGLVLFTQMQYKDVVSAANYGARYEEAYFAPRTTNQAPATLITNFSYYIVASNVGINTNQALNIPAEIYPNPSATQATLAFTLTKPGMVNITIHDVVGKEMQVVANGNMQAGKQQFTINTSNLTSGMYFYTITVDGASETNKFTVSK